MSTFPPTTLGRNLNNVFDPLQPRASLTLSNIVGTTTGPSYGYTVDGDTGYTSCALLPC